MAIAKIEFEGVANIALGNIVCICACGHHDNEYTMVEFNFREQKIFHTCGQCKKINEISFGHTRPTPFPKTRVS